MAAIELYSTPLFSDANLVSYWRFEGNSNDTKGSNNGTDTSITYSTGNGKFNQGAGFNGTSSKIVKTDSDNTLDMSGDHTVLAWINPTSITGFRPIASKRSGGTVNYNYAIGSSAGDGKLASYNGSTAVGSTGTISTGSWQLATFKYIHSTTTIYFYINGAASGSATQAVGAVNNADFNIGFDNADPNYYAGAIDDLAIFSRALTDTEILNYYNGTWGTGNFFMFL